MNNKKFLLGTLSGNAMEFYDFTVYAFMALYIANEFFVSSDPYVSHMLTFGVFASGYLVRPLGSIFFGYIGDRVNRDLALSLSLVLASVSTFLIAVIPGYKEVGVVAPLLLVFFRLLQGFSVSGEEGGAAVRLYESGCFYRRGFIGGSVLASVLFGVVLATIICSFVLFLIENHMVSEYFWRIPFFISLPLGMISLYLRVKNTKSSRIKVEHNSFPVILIMKNHLFSMLLCVAVVAEFSILTSTYIVHLPFYFETICGFTKTLSLIYVTSGLVMVIVSIFFLSNLYEKYEKFNMFFASLLMLATTSPFIFYVFSLGGSPGYIFIAMVLLSLNVALVSMPVFSILMDSFPKSVRYTGVSFSFNLAITIFSSSTPVVLIYLENRYQSIFAPAYYLSASAIAVALLVMLLKKRFIGNSYKLRLNYEHEL